MLKSSRLGRGLAVATAGGVAATLAWLPAGASATVQNQFGVGGNASASYTGTTSGATCDLTAGSSSTTTTPVVFSKGTKKQSADLFAAYTSSDNPTDVTTVTGHYNGQLTVARSHGDLKSFVMGGSGSLTVHHDLGSTSVCRISGLMGTEAVSEFTESHGGWLYLNRTTGAKPATTFFVLVNEATGDEPVFEIYNGGRSSADSRAWLKPGTYQIPEWLVGLSVNSGIFKAPLTNRMTGAFHAGGSALGAAQVSGKSYLKFPSSVQCGKHRATLTWKHKAGQLDHGDFLVNGHKAASVANPSAGHHVVLRHLSSTKDTKITARLSVTGGGHATATRTYVACKG